MTSADLQNLLLAMLQSGEGVSDFLFLVGKPPLIERYGKLYELPMDEASPTLQAPHTEAISTLLINGSERLQKDLDRIRLLRHELCARRAGAVPRQYLPAERPHRHRHAQAAIERADAGVAGPAADFPADREGKNRHRLRHRQHRQRQDDHARRAAERAKPDAGSARRDARGPDRVRASARPRGLQPAGAGQGLFGFRDRPARGVAAGAEGDFDRRNSRPRDDGDRADRLGNRPPRFQHAAHDQRRPDHQPHPRPLHQRRRKAGARTAGRHVALHRQPAARDQDRRAAACS